MKIRFTVPGPPQGKARPRLGKGRTYTPQKTREYEELVRACFRAKAPGILPSTGKISLEMEIYMPIPRSASKTVREKMLSGEIRPFKKPDSDNVEKAVWDALNGLAYFDDAQIVHNVTEKWYATVPCVVVTVWDEFGG